MCFWKKKKKEIKKNKIKPYVHCEDIQSMTTEDFLKETITCENCKKRFNLGSNEIKINCNGCNKFFHCGIAGKCNCSECKTLMGDNQIHNFSWCIHCVPNIERNKEKKDGIGYCICKLN